MKDHSAVTQSYDKNPVLVKGDGGGGGGGYHQFKFIFKPKICFTFMLIVIPPARPPSKK